MPSKIKICNSYSKNEFFDLENCIFYILTNFNLSHLQTASVHVLASRVREDLEFHPRSGQTKDYKIGICCFSAKHTSLRSKRKDWLARNQNNVFEWSDMSTRGLLFQWIISRVLV